MTKEVEGEFCLGKKLVPKEVGEGAREAGDDAEEVGFEGEDGALDDVATMDVWMH